MTEEPASTEDSQEDGIWIKEFQEGDDPAFEKIFNKYKVLVLNLAFRVVRIKETAEDIAQEVFLKIYRNKIAFDHRKAKFSTWLYRITVNTALDTLRKKRRSLTRALEEDIQGSCSVVDPKALTPRKILDDSERALIVQRQIDKLPRKLRLPLLLYQFEEMSYRDIAQVLEISPKAVERRIYHAKELLKGDRHLYFSL